MVFRLALAGSPLSPHLPSAAHPKDKAGARTGRRAMDNGRDECGARHAASELLPPTVQSHGPARRHAPVRVGPAQYSRRVRVKEVEQWSTPAAHAKPCLLAAQSMDLYNFPGPPHAHAAQCTYTRKWKSNFSTENGRKRKGRSHDVSENKLFRSQFPTYR